MTVEVSSQLKELLEDAVQLEADRLGFPPDVLMAKGAMRKDIVEARGRIWWRAYHQLGLSTGQIAKIAGVARNSVNKSIKRIEQRINDGHITDLPAKARSL